MTPSNISNWKHGGFVDWYREQQQRDVALAPLKALERCTRAVEIDRWQQNAVALAAEKFAIIMSQFNQQRAVEALHANPELLPKYIAAMTALSRCTTELAKSFDLTQKRQAVLHDGLPADSASVSNIPAEAVPSETSEPPVATRPNPSESSNGHLEPTGLNRVEPNLSRLNQIAPNLTSCPMTTPHDTQAGGAGTNGARRTLSQTLSHSAALRKVGRDVPIAPPNFPPLETTETAR